MSKISWVAKDKTSFNNLILMLNAEF